MAWRDVRETGLKINPPAIEYHAANYIRHSIWNESLTVERFALLSGEFLCNDIDFVNTSLLYGWLAHPKVTQGSHCKSPSELPVMDVENDAFARCYFYEKFRPDRSFAERFRFLHQSFSHSFWRTENNTRPMTEPQAEYIPKTTPKEKVTDYIPCTTYKMCTVLL